MQSNVAKFPRPEHGAKRDIGTVIAEKDTEKITFPNGKEYLLYERREEQSASARFCSRCDAWVTAIGIIGNAWCPNCKTEWIDKTR